MTVRIESRNPSNFPMLYRVKLKRELPVSSNIKVLRASLS